MDGLDKIGLGNWTNVELFWTFVTGACLVLMAGFLQEVIGDHRHIQRHQINGAMRIVARSGVRRQILKVAGSFFLFVPAVLSFFYPSPPPDSVRAVNILTLSAVPVVLLLINVIDRNERNALADYFSQNISLDDQKDVNDALQELEAKAIPVREETQDSQELGEEVRNEDQKG